MKTKAVWIATLIGASAAMSFQVGNVLMRWGSIRHSWLVTFCVLAEPVWLLTAALGLLALPLLGLAALSRLRWKGPLTEPYRLAGAAAFFTAWLLGARFMDPDALKRWEYLRWQEGLRDLPAAIERFHKDTGRYPGSLAQLVPRHYGHVPKSPTGRAVTIWVEEPDDPTAMGNPWTLRCEVPFTFSFDELIYDPNGRYPEDGGWLEPWGTWMYLHE